MDTRPFLKAEGGQQCRGVFCVVSLSFLICVALGVLAGEKTALTCKMGIDVGLTLMSCISPTLPTGRLNAPQGIALLR